MRSGGIALVWGPPRSGTTWLYNVVRAILDSAEIDHCDWVHGQRPPNSASGSALVIKAHQAHSVDILHSLDVIDHVFLVAMFRDPGDAFQSLLRTQSASRSELLEWLQRDIASIEQALPHFPGAVVCREEWVHDHSEKVIAHLCDWFGVPLAAEQRSAIARSLSRESVRSTVNELARNHGWSGDFVHFDPDTHWHAGHIAPPDHRRSPLTSEEEMVIDSLRQRVEYMTGTHSLLATVPARRRPPVDHPPTQLFLAAVDAQASTRQGAGLVGRVRRYLR